MTEVSKSGAEPESGADARFKRPSLLLGGAHLAALWAQAGDGSMPFAVGFDIAIAMPLSWLPLIADYSRFGKRARNVFDIKQCW